MSPIAGLHDQRITTFGLLVEAYARLESTFRRSLEERHGLPHTSFEALLRLARSPNETLTMGELTEQITLTPGGATRLVDRLIAAGHVERATCPTDRRVQQVTLTDAGRSILTAAIQTHRADLEAELFDRLSEREAKTLARLLAKLR